MVEYITKKIPRYLSKKLARLQARFSLRGGKKMTEGQIIALGLARLDEDLERQKRHSIMSIAGMIKGGEKSSEADIDEVLYG